MSANNVTHVTMIGPRGVGKGSILAAMVDQLDAMSEASGARFVPDDATAALMRSRQAALSGVFDDHLASAEFPLQSSMAGEAENLRTYRFAYCSGIFDKPRFSLEFTDIPTQRMAESAPEIIRQVQRSAVILIAIDAVALMEKDAQGLSWHEAVNMPGAIQTLLMDADLTNQDLIPQLVLFVPLKCEKYYHQSGGMDALEQAVRKAYKPVMDFLDKPRFTVGITPILTLGDVVFSRFDPDSSGYAPLYVFRRKDEAGQAYLPRYAPLYGEQPLCWMAAFLLQLEQFQKEKKRQSEGLFSRVVKEAFLLYMFGLLGLAARKLTSALKDEQVRRMMDVLRTNLKLQGGGYALIQDNLCMSGSDVSMKEIAAQLQ